MRIRKEEAEWVEDDAGRVQKWKSALKSYPHVSSS